VLQAGVHFVLLLANSDVLWYHARCAKLQDEAQASRICIGGAITPKTCAFFHFVLPYSWQNPAVCV